MSLMLTQTRSGVRPLPEEEEGGAIHPLQAQALPPTDQGSKAWKFLCGCFVIDAVLWGVPLSFGVFQDFYSRHPDFEDDPNIAVIGTVATSIYFLGAPFTAPAVVKYHALQRHMVFLGSAICILSLLGASFCTSITTLIATQGALYGIGFLMLYFPILCMLNEWFVRRRGLAYGLLYAGGGFSGAGLPFLLEWLLSSFGYKITLRAAAVAQFVLVAPVLPLIKGRLPPAPSSASRPVDLSFFARTQFWILMASNLCQGFAYYIPALYLPTFASALGYSGTVGALILAVNNMASILGQVSFGYLTDRIDNIYLLLFSSTSLSAIAAFGLWGMAHSLALLVVFAIVFGWCAGAYVVFWPRFGSLLSEDPQSVYSLMAFGKGVGNVVTGPISATLVAGPVRSGYGLGRFEGMILYVGSLMAASSLGVVGWPLRHTEGRRA